MKDLKDSPLPQKLNLWISWSPWLTKLQASRKIYPRSWMNMRNTRRSSVKRMLPSNRI